jgi:hypothetical protein
MEAPIMTSLTEKLQQLESQLAALSQVKPNNYKEGKKLERESEDIKSRIANLKAYLALEVGQRVTNGKQLGAITALALSPGGMPEAWVRWYGALETPVQPTRLKLEPFLQDLRVDSEIIINSQHSEAAGETLSIKEFRGDGWVLTTTNQLFHCDFFSVVNQPLTTSSEEMTESESVPVEVVTDELTPEEERERLFLERKVERAFYQAGKALTELRDRRLYRSTHKTFEEYCKDRFGFGRHAANRLIAGASVVENLVTISAQNQSEEMVPIGHQNQSGEMVPIGEQILPTTERQVRPLTQLEPDQQREAWQQAVSEAGGKVPSSRIVKDIVQRIRERTKVPIRYRVGDVCTILVKENPDLRGLGGCWCIVTEVRDFSCLVRAWSGEYIVKEENLKDLGYSPEQREEMRIISDRLFQLQSLKEEETAAAILEALGKLKRPYLKPLEERLLAVLVGLGR